jgi:hypothetical protein
LPPVNLTLAESRQITAALSSCTDWQGDQLAAATRARMRAHTNTDAGPLRLLPGERCLIADALRALRGDKRLNALHAALAARIDGALDRAALGVAGC